MGGGGGASFLSGGGGGWCPIGGISFDRGGVGSKKIMEVLSETINTYTHTIYIYTIYIHIIYTNIYTSKHINKYIYTGAKKNNLNSIIL